MSGTRKQVTVVINGEEYVSTAAKQAEAGITLFGKRIPFVLDATKLLEMGMNALRAAFAALRQFTMDSIRAYDDFSASQTKLSAMSKLTGVSMGEMRDLVKQARDEFGLSTVASSDLAGSVAKFASQAGSASKAGDLMAAALELGAASGMNASQVAEGLSSALAGNDEWLNRLGLANPSQLWKDYAAANGRAVGTLTDTEQKLAVMTAIMDAGNKVAGTYAERMESGAGAQDRLNNKIDDAKVAFGQAIQPLRVFVVQGLTTMVEVGGRVVLAIGRVANAIGVILTGAIEAYRSYVGYLAVGIGKLTGNKDIEDWGRRNSTAFSDFRSQLERLEDKYLTTGKAAEESATKQEGANRKAGASIKAVAETAEAAADRLNKTLDAKLGRPMQVVIGLTEGAIEKLGNAARDQLPPEKAAEFSGHMQDLAKRAAESRDNMLGLASKTTEASKSTKNTAEDISRVARSALDAAVAFGVIEASAANTLNSVINIASGIAGVISGDATSGVAAILTGITNVVASLLGGAAETRRLMRLNHEAMTKLSRDIGGLKLNVTEGDINAARTALGSVVGQLRGGRGAANENDVRTALEANGLSMGDLNRIAQELGITIRTSSGALNVEAVNSLFQALGTTRVGRLDSGFQSQLSFFQQGQNLDGASGLGGINSLLDFLRNVGGVTALEGLNANDPQALRQALRRMITQINNGEGVQGLGRMTGQQFMDMLVSIIGQIDGLPSGSAPAPSSPSVTGGSVTDDAPSGGSSAPSAPQETIQAVIKAMDARMLSVLSSHTPLIDRIAVATEGSWSELRTLNGKMDTLIEVTAGTIDATDAKLEAMRRLAALERGERPVLG